MMEPGILLLITAGLLALAAIDKPRSPMSGPRRLRHPGRSSIGPGEGRVAGIAPSNPPNGDLPLRPNFRGGTVLPPRCPTSS